MLPRQDGSDLTDRVILLIDDDEDTLAAFSILCESAGMRALTASTLVTAYSKMSQHRPDIICVDLNVPAGNGLAFCETLAADSTVASIPRIVLTGSNDASAMATASTEVFSAVVSKGPATWPTLQAEMRRLIGASEAASNKAPATVPERQKTVVVADDDKDIRDLLTERFEELGCKVLQATSSLEALHVIEGALPDLVCIDVDMPLGSGLSTAEMVSADSRLNMIPMIVLTGKTDPATIRRCHEMMAYYVPKSADVWRRIAPLVFDELNLPCRESSGPPDDSPAPAMNSPSQGEDRVDLSHC